VSVNNNQMHKAFSLIELLIVIVIIGVVYTMAIGNFEQIKDKKIKINSKANGTTKDIASSFEIYYSDNLFISSNGTASNITNVDSIEYNFDIEKLVLSKQIISPS